MESFNITQETFNTNLSMSVEERMEQATYWQQSAEFWYGMARMWHDDPHNIFWHDTIRRQDCAAASHRLARLFAGTYE